MAMTSTCSWGLGMCYAGEINGYKIHAQVLEHPSKQGIAEGRIVQFYISKSGLFSLGHCELSYSRGWDSVPSTGALRAVVEQAVRQIDGKQIDWAVERQR
ncbi:hypothetical protein FE782_28735 [Paenibacillus antri]|uniref:DUF7678 domain-containing protein n=1 Tax=Paenibacillus antri TaxID=2582848 RepID=A0A5R9GBR2_9BACL|nr:hypothetical protein [Paenibacillus antri]TLS48845.1 hypothetical protein FE782_28735 [Paenibacillus antri]